MGVQRGGGGKEELVRDLDNKADGLSPREASFGKAFLPWMY